MRSLRIVSSLGIVVALVGCGGGSSTTDAGTRVDAATGVDAAGGGPDGVHCAGAPADCTVGQVCCATPTGTTCVATPTCPTGSPIACDGSEDCPGALCCGDAVGIACSATCTGYHICHVDSECSTGERCCPNGGGQPQGSLQHCLALAAGTSCPLPP